MLVARSLATMLMVLILPAARSATSQEKATCTDNEASCDMKDTSLLSVRAVMNSQKATEQEGPPTRPPTPPPTQEPTEQEGPPTRPPTPPPTQEPTEQEGPPTRPPTPPPTQEPTEQEGPPTRPPTTPPTRRRRRRRRRPTLLASIVSTNSLKEIFQEANTDKFYRHGYHRYYETHLAPYRIVDGLRLLEIGADSGISLGSWMKYFYKPAAVQGVAYGVNVEKAKETACELMPEQCEKLAIYNLDQSDKTALANMMAQNPEGWDIIIDDGSHYPGHQIISFQQLWPKLHPGGLYVVEDIETSYADFGNAYAYPLSAGIGKPPPRNAVEQFKRLADVVSRKHFGQPEFTVFDGVDKDVAEVDFADGLIFIQKKPADPDWDKYPRDTFIGEDKSGKSFKEYLQKLQAEHLEEELQNDPNNKN